MKNRKFSRRDLLKGATVVVAGATFSTRVLASSPPPEPVTQALIDAAKKEGQVSYYTSTDLPVAEKVAKAFEAKYPGISVHTERTGAERVFQRIGQEYSSNIHAVDVVNSSDASHFIVWKRDGILVALRARGCREIPGRASRRRRPVRELPRLALDHRLQHQSGENRGSAEELCRPARTQMEGQDRQGPSRL